MRKLFVMPCALVAVTATSMLLLSGCGESAPTPTTTAAAESHEEGDDHDHGGWWCAEHGVPEGECARCDASLVAGFKEKGDWCEEHNRPDSQCFIDHPELEEKFAARYVAKYGKEPAKPTE